VIEGGTWGTRGVVYLNAERFQVKNVAGRAVTMNAPGEPFQDRNLNGAWDEGENWINLAYPETLDGPFIADESDSFRDRGAGGAFPVRNRRGPDVSANAVLWGILYTNGVFDASGSGLFYGAVMTLIGVDQTEPSAAGTASLYWDDRIPTDWPPRSWHLPRRVVTKCGVDCADPAPPRSLVQRGSGYPSTD